MGESLSIRPATERDLEAIQRIYNHAVLTTTATWDEAPWAMERRVQWFDEHGGDCPVLVAEAAGEVVGWASLSLMSQKSGWRFTRENTVYIDEPWRGKGVGSALMAALIDEARTLGIHVIVAQIASENAVSIEMHARLGFVECGTIREAGLKFGRRLDLTQMQLLLD